MSSRHNLFITVLLIIIGLLIAKCFAFADKCDKQQVLIRELTNKPAVIIKSNEYELAELRSQIAYYKTSYENTKYAYDRLSGGLGSWTQLIEGWLDQVNANYRR